MKTSILVKTTIFLVLMAGIAFSSQAQEDRNRGKTVESHFNESEQTVVSGFESGNEEVPEALGGGTVTTHSLEIARPNTRSLGTKLHPEDFGADDLHPGKWINNDYYIFVATDFVAIQGYYLYDAEEDKVYEIKYEVGEKMGYEKPLNGREVTFEKKGDMVVGYKIID